MNPPIARTLHLDERKLPAEVFDRLAKHGGYVMRDRRTREENREKAWESFGKPGRDPAAFGSVLNGIASGGHWTPQLSSPSCATTGIRSSARASPCTRRWLASPTAC